MKVVFIIDKFSDDWKSPAGGVQSSTINLINGLIMHQKSISIYILAIKANENIKNRPKNVRFIQIKPKHNFYALYNFKFLGISTKYEKKIAKIKPDIIHVIGLPTYLRKFDKKKTLITLHGVPYLDSYRSKNYKIFSAPRYFLSKYIFTNSLSNYENLIFLVKYSKNLFKKNLSKDSNYKLIPNAHDITVEPNIKKNISSEKILFWYGVIRPLKNIEFLIEICENLKDQNIIYKMVFAGNFSSRTYENQLRSIVKKKNLSDFIIFTGFLNQIELKDMLKRIHINLLPSKQEVCPMSIIECLAYSKPTIAFDVGGVSEIIQNKKNGFVTETDNKLDFLKNIIDLLQDDILYDKISKNAYRSSIKYNKKAISKKVLDYYYEIINNR